MSARYRGSGGGGNRGRRRGKREDRARGGVATQTAAAQRPEGPVSLGSVMSVGELAEALHVSPVEVITQLMSLGIMATINQQVDYETARSVAEALEIETEQLVPE